MDAPPPDFRMLEYIDREIAPRERLQSWRTMLGKKLLSVDITPLRDEPYGARASLRALPGVRFGWGSIDASLNRRTRRIVADDNDDVFVIVNFEGVLTVTQRGRENRLKAGDAYVVRCDEEASYGRPDTGRIMCLRLPHAALQGLVRDLDDRIPCTIPAQSPALQLLIRYVGLLDNSQPLLLADIRQRTASHICDLATLALGASRDTRVQVCERSLQAVRLHAITAWIDGNLSVPDLSVDLAAARHRLTVRQVQRLFESEGRSFTEYLREQRLLHAFRALSNPCLDERSITDIALDSGFGDLSYFNRLFRRRFHASPRELRNRHRR